MGKMNQAQREVGSVVVWVEKISPKFKIKFYEKKIF
jgi:hypothetical protein